MLLLRQYSIQAEHFAPLLSHWGSYILIFFSLTLLLITTLLIILKYFPNSPFIKRLALAANKDNSRMLAILTGLYPGPILSIDINGKITFANSAAACIMPGNALINRNIREVLPEIRLDYKRLISQGDTCEFNHEIQNKTYLVIACGAPSLNCIRLFLRIISREDNNEAKLRDLGLHMQDALEKEKQRIANELHDSVGQNLSIIRLIFNDLLDSDEKYELKRALTLLECSIHELRNISYNLKPRILQEAGLAPALISLGNIASEGSGIKGNVDIRSISGRLSMKLETCLYRIAQEAVNNIIRHSGATQFKLRLSQVKNSVRLMVSDNGKGFDVRETLLNDKSITNLGLINMRQRAECFNGTLKLKSSKGQGSMIIVDIPLENYLEENN